MLKKQYRVRKKKEFDNVFTKGRFISDKKVSLKFVKNGFDFSRFAFVVSNKVSRKAYKRNRTKRLLRESVRLLFEDVKEGFDIVFLVRTDISDKSFKEINDIVDKLLKRSGLFKVNRVCDKKNNFENN